MKRKFIDTEIKLYVLISQKEELLENDYDNVLKEFDLPDVKSSVKMFYSINELGREQSTKQIGAIIDRNNKLSGQTEEMKNKDRIGIAAMYSVIPMFLGVLKIIVDMLLMILVFTSSISEVVK